MSDRKKITALDSASLSTLNLMGVTIYDDGLTTYQVDLETLKQFLLTGSTPTDSIKFNTGTTQDYEVGKMFYDDTHKTISAMLENDVILQIGQESQILVYNDTDSTILNGQLVYFTGSYGETPTVALANAGNDLTSIVVGMATQNILSGTTGIITSRGLIHDIDTSSYTPGDILYLSDIVDGGFTTSIPSSFSSRVNRIGFVAATGVTDGSVYFLTDIENTSFSLTDREKNILQGNVISTGVDYFEGATVTSSTTFDIGVASGWIVDNISNPDNPTVTRISYTGATGVTSPYISTNIATYVLLTTGSTLTLQSTRPTAEERRKNVYLCKIAHPVLGTFQNVNNNPDVEISPFSTLRDMFTPIKLIKDGIACSPNGSNLSFNVSAGTLYGIGINFATNSWDPNTVEISAQDPVTFQYRTQVGSITGNTTFIDPTLYESSAGVLSAVTGMGANTSTNQRIYLFPTGVIRVQYGQKLYSNVAAAQGGIATETFIENPNFTSDGILIGILSVRGSATNLSLSIDAAFTPVGIFGQTATGNIGLSTGTLQTAYDNSVEPEILTNSTLDGLTIRRGSAADTDSLIQFQNGASQTKGRITGAGHAYFSNLTVSGFTGTISATPTAAEITAILGSPSSFNDGYTTIIRDLGDGIPVIRVTASGGSWYYTILTLAT